LSARVLSALLKRTALTRTQAGVGSDPSVRNRRF